MSKKVAYVGIFSSLCVILQSAPVYLPTIGMAISPFSTLPIMLLTMFMPLYGLFALPVSTALLFLISPQEAALFFFTTGLLGFVIGLSSKKHMLLSALYAAIALFLGIMILLYGFKINVLGDLFDRNTSALFLPLLFIFACIYSILWVVIAKLFSKRLKKM